MLKPRAFWLLTIALALPMSATAHPGHIHGKDDADHETSAPSPEQIKKRLERVEKRHLERQQKRAQRQKDRRRALAKRLFVRLDGAAITPEITAELKIHAQRVARLRQIRYVAATKDDFDTVQATDKALAGENARHERWWRSALKPATAASAPRPEKAP